LLGSCVDRPKLYGETLDISFKEEPRDYLHTEALSGAFDCLEISGAQGSMICCPPTRASVGSCLLCCPGAICRFSDSENDEENALWVRFEEDVAAGWE
jgi:hypothetical protein